MLRLLVTVLRFAVRRGREHVRVPDGISTLAVIELTRLGDFVSVLPCLVALRRRFPASRILVVASEAHAPLVSLCGADVEVISVPERGTLRGLVRAARAVRRARPELACSMGPSNRNAALALSSGAPFIAGYLATVRTVTPFLNIIPVEIRGFSAVDDVAFNGEVIHERPWKVLQALGVPAAPGPFAVKPPVSRPVERLLPEGARTPYIVIHPFSGWRFRSWPVSRFVSLAQSLPGMLGVDILFLAHEREGDGLAALAGALRGVPRVFCLACTDILDASALIGGALLFIGNDSGPLHLAALLGVPVVGLFGPAGPELTAPSAARSAFLYQRVPCSPCTQRRCVMPGNPCMDRIPVQEVIEAAARLLNHPAREALAAHG